MSRFVVQVKTDAGWMTRHGRYATEQHAQDAVKNLRKSIANEMRVMPERKAARP